MGNILLHIRKMILKASTFYKLYQSSVSSPTACGGVVDYGNIMLVKKDLTSDEARKIYESDPNNEHIIGLKEYFEDTKKYKLTQE